MLLENDILSIKEIQSYPNVAVYINMFVCNTNKTVYTWDVRS